MSGHGYYGAAYDRQVPLNNDQSTIYKMKETYWTTKQAVMKKLGKKEDEHIVASDSELDAKLEVFKAIQKSSMDLLRVIERYQDRICVLSREENAMGRLLKAESQHDKTRAGKMMAAVGKAQSFSSQQMLQLRSPLVRLYQEVETFRYRAISDTLVTVNRMEVARTEYRGALLWMKDVSEELDPDTSKQLQKFRTVQAQVKKTKAKFDKLKLDTMQKIDLLAASRCNMFSHVLAKYQSTLLHFWERTAYRMTAVAESFKGYQYFEFNMLKELGEPSKKLAEETGSHEAPEHDIDDSQDELGSATGVLPAVPPIPKAAGTLASYGDEQLSPVLNSSLNLQKRAISKDENKTESSNAVKNLSGSLNNLLSAVDKEFAKSDDAHSKMTDTSAPFIDFGDEDDEEEADLDEIRRKQDEEFDFSGALQRVASDSQKKTTIKGAVDLLTDDFEVDDSEKDDLKILNEILNAPTSGGDDFSREWQAVFGSTPLSPSTNLTPVESDNARAAEFMPSCLLDMTSGIGTSSGAIQRTGAMVAPMTASGGIQGMTPGQQSKTMSSQTGPKSKRNQKQEMSAWFNLFAELDPLANPDAIGRNKEDLTDA